MSTEFKREFGLKDETEVKRVKFEINDAQPTNSEITLTMPTSSGTLLSTGDTTEAPVTFDEEEFRVFKTEDSADNIRFDLSALSTGTRTITFRDTDGTAAMLSDIPTPPVTFDEDEFRVTKNGDSSAGIRFNLDDFQSGITRQLTVRAGGGVAFDETIAYLSDITFVESGTVIPTVSSSSNVAITNIRASYMRMGSIVSVNGGFTGVLSGVSNFNFTLQFSGIPGTGSSGSSGSTGFRTGGGYGAAGTAGYASIGLTRVSGTGSFAFFGNASTAAGTYEFGFNLQYSTA